jgi:hypothetical protein
VPTNDRAGLVRLGGAHKLDGTCGLDGTKLSEMANLCSGDEKSFVPEAGDLPIAHGVDAVSISFGSVVVVELSSRLTENVAGVMSPPAQEILPFFAFATGVFKSPPLRL